MYKVKLLKGYLKQTIHLLALFTSLECGEGRWWREPRTYEKQCVWDDISTCSTWVYEPIKVWVYVVLLYMIRITIPSWVVLLDLAHVMIEYFLEKGSANEEPDQEVGQDVCNCRLMKLRR